ncbi:MAG: NADH-quinone oxidoreductase subunit NuoE [candidate division WOR-3 bacterium]|nr:NADH-quinone oxidoreductase subunit NuoE [candidate division WOR-3 bacterium]
MKNQQSTIDEDTIAIDRVKEIINNYGKKRQSLIAILQDIQEEFHYLPESAICEVAKELNVPLSEVYSIATFFHAFSLTPRGKHTCTVCMGTACHVRGAPRILEEFERQLNIKPGETTQDRQFSLESVNCLGCCAIGPVVVIDKDYYGQMNTNRVAKLIKQYQTKSTKRNAQ